MLYRRTLLLLITAPLLAWLGCQRGAPLPVPAGGANGTPTEQMTILVLDVADIAPRRGDTLASGDDLSALPELIEGVYERWPETLRPESIELKEGQLVVRGDHQGILAVAGLINELKSAEVERADGIGLPPYAVAPSEVTQPLAPKLVLKVYPVGVLLGPGATPADCEELAELTTAMVEPFGWDSVGGEGMLQAWRGELVVLQTDEIHQEIEGFFSQLAEARELVATWDGHTPPPTSIPPPDPCAGRPSSIWQMFQEEVNFDEGTMTLREFMFFLQERYEVPVTTDEEDLAAIGYDLDAQEVTLAGQGRLAAVLEACLEPLDLTCVTNCSEIILLQRDSEYGWTPYYLVYPVHDLTAVEENELIPTSRQQLEQLAAVIRQTCTPESWDDVGGEGWTWMLGEGILVILNRPALHEEIQAHLEARRDLEPAPAP